MDCKGGDCCVGVCVLKSKKNAKCMDTSVTPASNAWGENCDPSDLQCLLTR